MRFFKLTHPKYTDDHEENLRNPVRSVTQYRIPGIICDVCGPWSSSERLRIPLPPHVEDFTGNRFLPVAEWKRISPSWAAAIGVPVEALAPGAQLGPPKGECIAEVQEECVHPVPGEIWVVARIVEILAAGVTGISFARVELTGDCKELELWELVVHGRAWREGSTEDSIRACDLCGRRVFPRPNVLSVDTSRWDGSDFVSLDYNPNIIVVTERVADLVDSHGVSNLIAEAIG